MKIRNLFQKLTFAGLLAAILFSAALRTYTQTAPKQEILLNGLKVLLWDDAGADKVTVKIRIHSGSAFDPQGREGLMQMLADNIFPNSASREFFTEDLGGGLEIVANYDYIQINATSKPEHFLTMLETLSSAVSNPPIDKETTAKLRAALLAKVKALESDPAYVADQAVAKRLFGTFPYGRPQLGTPESVQKIEFADLLDARTRFLNADNATITVSGNFNRALALKAFRRDFGGWRKSDGRVPPTFRQPDEPYAKILNIEMAGIEKQYSRSGQMAPARSDKDYYSMMVYYKIRQESGCTRSSSKYQANLLKGVYVTSFDDGVFYMGPCPIPAMGSGDDADEITQEDFDGAKTRMLAALQVQGVLTDLWLDIDTYRLGSVDDEIRKANAVTLSDVKSISKKLLTTPGVKVLLIPPSKTN